MLVLKIKPCMPKYRWINNRNCGWLNKSVIIKLVKQGNRRITLLIVELIQEEDSPTYGRISIYQLNFYIIVILYRKGKKNNISLYTGI